MKTLYSMLIKDVLSTLFVATVFFILLLEVVDLFSNLSRYILAEVPLFDVLKITILYIPKCISYSLPISTLFAISYTLGNYYSANELIAVFGSGISLYKLTFPLLVLGAYLSVGSFFFEDKVVITTFQQKNDMNKSVLGQKISYNNALITLMTQQGKIIYSSTYYNDTNETLSQLTIIERDDQGTFLRRIDAEKAYWDRDFWVLQNARVFDWDTEGQIINETSYRSYTQVNLTEPPASFRKVVRDIDEVPIDDAKEIIEKQKAAGLPYKEMLTAYYQRYSFALTPLIVAFLSSALGGRFKKNILLMSLLSSLIISVLFYVIRMIAVLFSKLDILPPIVGAWLALFVFLILGIILYEQAVT